jgi:Acyltransferase family
MTNPTRPRDDTAAPAAAPRLVALDGLRGVFALGVMAFHYLMWTAPPEAQPARALVLAVGLYCVDGFFVISGLSLTVASHATDWRRPRQWLAYAVRRFARLWPLYAAATLLAAIVLVRNGVPAGRVLRPWGVGAACRRADPGRGQRRGVGRCRQRQPGDAGAPALPFWSR